MSHHSTEVRLVLGLRSTAQSLGVIGRDTGIFRRHGIDLRIVREETAGPVGAQCLIGGECDIGEFGAVPVVQALLDGADPVIVLAAEQISALHVLGAAGVDSPEKLVGRRVGVLSAAGQTGFSVTQLLQQWGISHQVELAELGTYPRIYDALKSGTISGGILTADYGIAGASAFGFTTLADVGATLRYQGPIVATTQRFIDAHPDTVQRIVNAYVDTIRTFKRSADLVIPILERHLGFVDTSQAQAIQAFYADRFQDVPHASAEGMGRILDSMHPDAGSVDLERAINRRFVDHAVATG